MGIKFINKKNLYEAKVCDPKHSSDKLISSCPNSFSLLSLSHLTFYQTHDGITEKCVTQFVL